MLVARQTLRYELCQIIELKSSSLSHTYFFTIIAVMVLIMTPEVCGQGRRVTRPTIQQTAAPVTQPEQPIKQPSANGKLTLKVCCGDSESNCEEFQRPEDMFGIGCCGGQPINEFEEICCKGVTRRRRQTSGYVEGCCGNQTLSFDQTCCQEVVHNVPNGECCGSQAYPRNNMNILCCNGVLIVNVEPGLTCCGTIPYDGGIRESCCGDAVYLKELYDGCCPVRGSDPPEYRQFNSRTHQCCDVPIERYSNTKCCQLYDPTAIHDQWRPKSYDSSTSCCAFPFTAIVPKNGEGTCARVTAPLKPPPTTNTQGGGAVTNPATTETDLNNNNNIESKGQSNVDNDFNTNKNGGRNGSNGGRTGGNSDWIETGGGQTANNNGEEESEYEDEEFGPEEPDDGQTTLRE